jgi:hypothetical protein
MALGASAVEDAAGRAALAVLSLSRKKIGAEVQPLLQSSNCRPLLFRHGVELLCAAFGFCSRA